MLNRYNSVYILCQYSVDCVLDIVDCVLDIVSGLTAKMKAGKAIFYTDIIMQDVLLFVASLCCIYTYTFWCSKNSLEYKQRCSCTEAATIGQTMNLCFFDHADSTMQRVSLMASILWFTSGGACDVCCLFPCPFAF